MTGTEIVQAYLLAINEIGIALATATLKASFGM